MSAQLRLRVAPNARRSEVAGAHGEAIKVKVQAPAIDGKANEALGEFIAEALGVARRDVQLMAGEKSRDKVLSIASRTTEEVRTRLLGAKS